MEVSVKSQGGTRDSLQTGWSKRQYEASKGLDFGSNVSVILNLKYLNHRPFNYRIMVNNTSGAAKTGTVRIFMAPKYNERAEEMSFTDQRLLWAEMDKFNETLPPGPHNIIRQSLASSVTNPQEFSFKDLKELDMRNETETQEDVRCKCGWPQHLLLPRGKREGMAFQLFVMITDYEHDKVPQENNQYQCKRGMSLCGGHHGQKYPDARPMGFPFDRLSDCTSAMNMSIAFTNILMHNITITFTDDVIPI